MKNNAMPAAIGRHCLFFTLYQTDKRESIDYEVS